MAVKRRYGLCRSCSHSFPMREGKTVRNQVMGHCIYGHLIGGGPCGGGGCCHPNCPGSFKLPATPDAGADAPPEVR